MVDELVRLLDDPAGHAVPLVPAPAGLRDRLWWATSSRPGIDAAAARGVGVLSGRPGAEADLERYWARSVQPAPRVAVARPAAADGHPEEFARRWEADPARSWATMLLVQTQPARAGLAAHLRTGCRAQQAHARVPDRVAPQHQPRSTDNGHRAGSCWRWAVARARLEAAAISSGSTAVISRWRGPWIDQDSGPLAGELLEGSVVGHRHARAVNPMARLHSAPMGSSASPVRFEDQHQGVQVRVPALETMLGVIAPASSVPRPRTASRAVQPAASPAATARAGVDQPTRAATANPASSIVSFDLTATARTAQAPAAASPRMT